MRSFYFYLLCCSVVFLGCSEKTSQIQSADLVAPLEGKGFHFETKNIEVPFGTEEQDCYFFQIFGDGTDPIFINRFEVAQNPGSHHMNLFRVRTIQDLDPANGLIQTSANGVGPCADSKNWADWPLIMNSQQEGHLEWNLPEGVAHRFEPGEWFMLQTHYVNATTQPTPTFGHVEMNFWTIPATQVTAEVGGLFATKQSTRVCKSNPTPTFEGSCNLNNPTPIHIIGANAHFHSRGTEFNFYSWDGKSSDRPPKSDQFYQSREWDHPPMSRSPELDLMVPANGGIWYTCTYEWKEPPGELTCQDVDKFDVLNYQTPEEGLDCCYVFGNNTQLGEHCNVFLYYYPKVDNINCF